MFAAGWHASMEKAKDIVAYAVRPGAAALNTFVHLLKSISQFIQVVADIVLFYSYSRCIKELPKVAQVYRDGLLSLFPGGGHEIDEFAMRYVLLTTCCNLMPDLYYY